MPDTAAFDCRAFGPLTRLILGYGIGKLQPHLRTIHRPFFAPLGGQSMRDACLLSLLVALGVPMAALAAGDCRFPPSPPVVLKDMGPCRFDQGTMTFEGDATQQARCLLSPVMTFGKIEAPRATLPSALADYVGKARDLPAPAFLLSLMRERGIDQNFSLDQPIAHAHDNDPLSRSVTYFVIHDTSSPNYKGRAWPSNIDSDRSINNLGRYACANKIERAHVFINRPGDIMLAHDFSVPWRATKFEMAQDFGGALKGLFLHVELVQPRRRFPGRGRANDFLAPAPGFTAAQYDSLALVYAIASRRAGFWLIPAFHAVIDDGIRDKHDDPQNFDLAAFADSVEALRRSARRFAAEGAGQNR
jgi:hypothetical protein